MQNTPQGFGRCLRFTDRVEGRKAEAYGSMPKRPRCAMSQGCTMKSGTDSNTSPPQRMSCFLAIHTLQLQRHNSRLTGIVLRPKKTHIRIFGHKIHKHRCKLSFMAKHRYRRKFLQPMNTCQQPGYAGNIMSPRLQPVRQIFGHGFLLAGRSGPSFHQRLCSASAEKNTDPLRPQEALVSRHSCKRTPKPLKIKWYHPRRLCRIHDQGHFVLPTKVSNLLQRQNISKHIGHMTAYGAGRTG